MDDAQRWIVSSSSSGTARGGPFGTPRLRQEQRRPRRGGSPAKVVRRGGAGIRGDFFLSRQWRRVGAGAGVWWLVPVVKWWKGREKWTSLTGTKAGQFQTVTLRGLLASVLTMWISSYPTTRSQQHPLLILQNCSCHSPKAAVIYSKPAKQQAHKANLNDGLQLPTVGWSAFHVMYRVQGILLAKEQREHVFRVQRDGGCFELQVRFT